MGLAAPPAACAAGRLWGCCPRGRARPHDFLQGRGVPAASCQTRGRGVCWEQRPSLDTKPHDTSGETGQGFPSCSEPSTCSATAAASQGMTRPQNLRHHSLLQLGGATLGVLHRSRRLHRSHGHRQQRRCTSWHVPQHHHPAMRQAGLGAAPRRASWVRPRRAGTLTAGSRQSPRSQRCPV